MVGVVAAALGGWKRGGVEGDAVQGVAAARGIRSGGWQSAGR